MEKLGRYFTSGQATSFNEICKELNDFIQFAISAEDQAAYKQISDMLYAIHARLQSESEELSEKGGAIRFFAEEFKQLADNVKSYTMA